MSSLGVANRKEGRHRRTWNNYVSPQILLSQPVCIEEERKNDSYGSDASLWVGASPVSNLGYFSETLNHKKKNPPRLLGLIKRLGSFKGGLCIHRAPVLQHAAVAYIILRMRALHTRTQTLDLN